MRHPGSAPAGLKIVGGEAVEWLYRILLHVPTSASEGDADCLVLHHKALPSGSHAALLLPAESREAAVAAVIEYSRLRKMRVTLGRSALGLLLRIAGQRALRHEVSARVSADVLSDVDLAEVSLLEHLRQVLDEPEAVAAVRLLSTRPMPKPVLQLFRSDGTPLAYAKVGWNAVTRRWVEHEASALRTLEGRRTRWLAVPRLLYSGSWHGRYVAITAALPTDVRRLSRGDPDPFEVAHEVPQVDPAGRATVGGSAYWQGMLADLEQLSTREGLGQVLDAASRVVETVRARYADVELDWGRWHGDWTPWNLAANRKNVWAWDWEWSAPGVPVGFDVLQYVVQKGLVREDRTLRRALSSARMAAHEWLPRTGRRGAAVDATVALHRLELLRRWARWAGEMHADPRFDPEALAAL